MSESERDAEARSWESLEAEADRAADELRAHMAGLRGKVFSLWAGIQEDAEAP